MFCRTLHIASSIHFIYWPNYTLNTAHCTFHALYTAYTDPTTHYTLHCTVHWKSGLCTVRAGWVAAEGGTAQHCIVLHYTTLGLLLYFTLLHSNIWYYSVKLWRSTLFYSWLQYKAFDTLLVLQIVLVLFLLPVVPTFKFNLLFHDSMTMWIMEKKGFMENLYSYIKKYSQYLHIRTYFNEGF